MAVMTKSAETSDAFYKLIHEPRVKALCIGPGAGVNEATQKRAIAMLETELPCVLDADALQPEIIKSAHAGTVITPHAGEFVRLFGRHDHKIAGIEHAFSTFSGVIVYKGSDTVIAQKGRKLIINGNAPATLATAGSGDVLAGMITGLLAQGMGAFDAACAAVWMHAVAANQLGRFMTAEDLVAELGKLQD